MTQENIGTYRVGIEVGDFEGWTQETLAAALVAPLAELGFEVELVRNSTVLDSIVIDSAESMEDADRIRESVQAVVERVIEG